MTDQELAAALVLAIESGLLSAAEAVLRIDDEIGARTTPATWLLDASLSRSAQDLLHVLRAQGNGHPMLSDGIAVIEAIEVAASAGRAKEDRALSAILRLYPYPKLPADLHDLLYALDEEATCAHAQDGVPQPAEVRRALRELLTAARGRSRWRDRLEYVLRTQK